METVIAILLGLILVTLLGMHKTLQEFQSTSMADANAQINAIEVTNALAKKWDQEGMPEQRNEGTK